MTSTTTTTTPTATTTNKKTTASSGSIMGCLLTSPYSPLFYIITKGGSSPRSTSEEKQDEPKVYSWDVRRKIDPKDFTIESKSNETIVRLPGSINGMQFIIQNLENCTVYLFDHLAQISIDDCKNCKIFIGPTKGSVFIRDCSDCNIATICQQFRTRDCKRVTTFLSCVTQPIIESSASMKFGCVTVQYSQLNDQIKEAKISIFNNNWSNIHDFTPIPGEQNYSLITNRDEKLANFIPMPDLTLCSQLNVSFSKEDSAIPFTCGLISRPNNESCLIVLFVDDSGPQSLFKQETLAKSLIIGLRRNHPDLVLVQTKQFSLSELSAENVFGSKNYNKLLTKGPIIGLEYNGLEATSKCTSATQLLSIDSVFISKPSPNLQHQIDNFYNFADMQMAV